MKGHGQKGQSTLRSTKTKEPISEPTAETYNRAGPPKLQKDVMYSSKYFQLKRRKTQPPLPIRQGDSPRYPAKATEK
jgi:hypothetical protein